MKVESSQKRQNGCFEGPPGKLGSTPPRSCIREESSDVAMHDVEGTTTNGCVSGENIELESISSPYSVSDVDSGLDDDSWSLTGTESEFESEAESSDLDDIVTTGTDVCHAATLEAFLENLEFIPAEVNRILKLIGTLDEKCEEITELLEHPCDEWFALHRTKKQKKSNVVEHGEAVNGEVQSSSLGSENKDMMVYKKIYEGQEPIGFEAYKVRLARARKLERKKEIDARAQELTCLPDSDFKIIYEKDGETMGDAERGEMDPNAKTQPAPPSAASKGWDGAMEAVAESQDSQRMKAITPEKGKTSTDLIANYFYQMEQEAASLHVEGGEFMEIDSEGFPVEASAMGEDWKEQLDEILHENKTMTTLHTFLENQLTLLWRYTLRKKALTRKVYETVLHHYASLVQELEPNKFGASLRCYPEATLIQRAMLNELQEQYVSPEEMTELYKDVEELLAHCDTVDDGCIHVSGDPSTQQDPQPAFVKQEEPSAAPLFSQDSGRKLLMDENFRNDKGGTCSARPVVNGAVSVYSPSTGSAQAYARSEGPSNVGDAHSRRARNKRHKPAKAPSGMSHAAKSPQSTGRLLTYHDIATPASAEKLSGHPAELFWPDDDLWYLIHIDVIDPETKTANIAYTTGETERLELDDIVREGHMSLLPEAEDTDLSVDEDMPQQTADVDLGEEVISELSASEMRGAFLDEPSAEEDEMGSEDEEEEVMVNIHRSRQSRRAELKAGEMHVQQKSS